MPDKLLQVKVKKDHTELTLLFNNVEVTVVARADYHGDEGIPDDAVAVVLVKKGSGDEQTIPVFPGMNVKMPNLWAPWKE